MQTLTDTYSAPGPADDRAAAVQAVETHMQDGFAATTIEIRADPTGATIIDVTYSRKEA